MRVRRLIRYSIYISGTVVIIIAAYGALLAYPERLFAHRYSYRNFVIYSRNPIDDRLYVPMAFDRDKEVRVNQLLWAGKFPFKQISN
jgi:hypothetical protein